MRTILMTFLFLTFSVEVFSKPNIHIINRHNGGLLSNRTVINSNQEDANFIYHIVDCSGSVGTKNENLGFILRDGTSNSTVLKSIMNRIDEGISNRNSSGGKFNNDDQYYVIWTSYTVDDRIEETITIYTQQDDKPKRFYKSLFASELITSFTGILSL